MSPTALASCPMYVCVVPTSFPEREEVEERLLEAADEEHPLVEGRKRSHLEVAEVGEPLRDGGLFLLRQLVALGALELAEDDLAQLGRRVRRTAV